MFTEKEQTTFIPLFNTNETIPFLVIQWGFLGGLVYTSISLLNRFLRKDLVPRVYFNASFRLLLSSVVAIVIYFLSPFRYPGYPDSIAPPSEILLVCFLVGVSPIQFLIHFADTQLLKIYKLRRRSTAGGRPITLLEGINSITAQRLSEEGIDSIQQMALCDYNELYSKTKFPINIVKDWKDQAVLYLLTGDICNKNSYYYKG